MLASKVPPRRAFALRPTKEGVLPDLPIRVRAQQIRIPGRKVQSCPPVPVFRNAREYGFKLSQETRRILLNHGRIVRISGEGRANVASGVIHKDAGSTVLGAADIPSVLLSVARLIRPVLIAPRPVTIPPPGID